MCEQHTVTPLPTFATPVHTLELRCSGQRFAAPSQRLSEQY